MSTRSVGDEFEKQLEKRLGVQRTSKSGGHWDDADLADYTTLIEAKVVSKPFFSPKSRDIKKLIRQADKHFKDWIYIQKTDGGTFVVLDLEFFLSMWGCFKGND